MVRSKTLLDNWDELLRVAGAWSCFLLAYVGPAGASSTGPCPCSGTTACSIAPDLHKGIADQINTATTFRNA